MPNRRNQRDYDDRDFRDDRDYRDQRRRRNQPAHPGATAWVVFLALAAFAAFFLYNNVFVIKSVGVEGTRFVEKQTVIDLSGIKAGESIFMLRDGDIAAGINTNRYLTYAGKRLVFPDHVILTVRENTPAAQMRWAGRTLMLDSDLTVLEDSAGLSASLLVPYITGASPDNPRLGSKVKFTVAGQAEAIEAILDELQTQDMTSFISELNVSSLDNLTLVTDEGLYIKLGNNDDLEEKLILAHSAVTYLKAEPSYTLKNAILDVSSGKTADFKPSK